jgi:serine protease Do
MGSGFVLSPDGYVVTNDHVAAGSAEITVAFPDGTTLPATLVGTDAASDLALLKVESETPLAHLNFASTDDPIVGEWCIALGNPYGLFGAADPTVTVGVVSAIGRSLAPQGGRIYRDMIQTDAAINRGNSGGPLLNALGEVIGVNTAIISESGGSVGLGFAVPAERARRVVDEIREKGFVDRSYYTGLQVRDMNARIAQALRLAEARGVLVEDIEANSPAAKAGFRSYDVILAVDGDPIANRNDIVARLYDFRPGDSVRFTVLREGGEVSLIMQLGTSQSG